MLLAAAWPLHCAVANEVLADMSLEELSDIEITSVSRRPEPLADAAASIYVITAEAIRRSGATSLPEALRLAPNLQVAQTGAAQYAITARGFNNAIGNKLLVLIDGRTVYTPFFSGVFWDQQDVMLDDVERIEVISGPGATLWGANAVNGVINVITRPASDTQGTLLVAGAGTQGTQWAARYGARAGADGHFRIYAKGSNWIHSRTAAGTALADLWGQQQTGFRGDWALGRDEFTLQGDAYWDKSEPRLFGTMPVAAVDASGANLLARWTRRFADDSNLHVQAYYDRSRRDDALLYRPREAISDIEFQHALQWRSHKLLWGAGYRQARDDLEPGLFFGFHPTRKTQSWSDLFVQDDVELMPALVLTLGAKLERNDYTGTENLPSARLAWKPAPNQLLWAELSRAVRAPARLDHDISLPPQPPYLIAGGPDFISEVAKVFELGWRGQIDSTLNASATLYLHDWSRLRSGQPVPDAMVQNMIAGKTYGFESWATWQAASHWRLSAGLAVLREDLHVEPGSTDPVGPSALGNDPQLQWSLRTSYDLGATQEIDLSLRHVAALPDPVVPAYTAVDLRYGWRVRPDLTLSVVGQNLFDPQHAEFGSAPDRATVARGLFVQLRWAP